MKRLTDIKINRFQLNVLLDDQQKEGFNFLVKQNIYCVTCSGFCKKGVIIEEIFLNSLNDIMIKGKCKVCNGQVARIMEFGEDKDFFNKANDFRKSIEN